MKVLLLDIETTPHITYSWTLGEERTPIQRVIEAGRMLCWAAKWHGEEKAHFCSEWGDGREEMLLTLWVMLDEADVVVHYNGISFDEKHINREFILAGMTPPSPYRSVDLLRTVRRKFKFASNKLQFVCQSLEIGSKVQHRGFDLWTGCMADDSECQQEMETYNIGDIEVLESLYHTLMPWITDHPSMGTFIDSSKPVCRCGSESLQKRGFYRTNARVYQRYNCSDCGAWLRASKCIKPSPEGIVY